MTWEVLTPLWQPRGVVLQGSFKFRCCLIEEQLSPWAVCVPIWVCNGDRCLDNWDCILLMPNSPNLTQNMPVCLSIFLSVCLSYCICLFHQYVGLTVVLLNRSVCLSVCLSLYLHIHIYIYAFSRRFYPKRLTIAVRLYIFVSMCVPWESNPQSFALLTQCSTTEPHRNTFIVLHSKNAGLKITLP